MHFKKFCNLSGHNYFLNLKMISIANKGVRFHFKIKKLKYFFYVDEECVPQEIVFIYQKYVLKFRSFFS